MMRLLKPWKVKVAGTVEVDLSCCSHPESTRGRKRVSGPAEALY